MPRQAMWRIQIRGSGFESTDPDLTYVDILLTNLPTPNLVISPIVNSQPSFLGIRSDRCEPRVYRVCKLGRFSAGLFTIHPNIAVQLSLTFSRKDPVITFLGCSQRE